MNFSLFFFFVILFLPIFAEETHSFQTLVESGDRAFVNANNATFYEERQSLLSEALSSYFKARALNDPFWLDKRIGDLFFTIENRPWATLFYERSLVKNPKQPELIGKIVEMNQSPNSETKSVLLYGLSFALFILLVSWQIWFPSKNSPFFIAAASFILLTCSFNLLSIYYFSPLPAVMVRSSGLYLEPDETKPLIQAFPLEAGSRVGILAMEPKKRFVKIIDSEKQTGFIPIENVRMIAK